MVSIDVLLDPSLPGTGSFSGVLIASNPTGTVARTAFGFGLESEHHDLTVQLKPRSGTQSGTHVIGLASLDGSFFDQRVVTGSAAQSITWRVPPGEYSAGAISFELAADGAEEGVLTYYLEVAVNSTTTITLDGDEAARFGHSVDQPVLSDGQFIAVFWNTNTGGTGFTFAGNADRLYAKPLELGTGTVESYLNWMLPQPDAEPVGPGSPLPLKSLGGGPALEGKAFPVVDAGSVAALRTGPLARRLRSSPATATTSGLQPQRFRPRGAVAVVAYRVPEPTAPGRSARRRCRSSKRGRSTCSACSSTIGRPGSVTHESPDYIYDLAGAWNGFVPDGAVLEGATRKLGAIVERYDSLGPAAKDGHQVWAMPLGWMPGGYAAFGLVRPVAVPSTVTHYVSPAAEWERTVEVRDAGGLTEGFLSAPRHVFAAGTTTRDEWFGGPITSRVAPSTAPWDYSSPYRQEDYFLLGMPPFVDQAGHQGGVLYLDEPAGQLFQDGELIAEGDDPLFLQAFVPPERHDYRLVYSLFRNNAFWQRSSRATTEWEFSSQRPEGDHEVTPLLSDRRRPTAFGDQHGAGRQALLLRPRLPHAARGGREATRARERRGVLGRRGDMDCAPRARVPDEEVVHDQAEELALRLGLVQGFRGRHGRAGGDSDRDRRLRRRLAGGCRGRSARERKNGEGRT